MQDLIRRRQAGMAITQPKTKSIGALKWLKSEDMLLKFN